MKNRLVREKNKKEKKAQDKHFVLEIQDGTIGTKSKITKENK